MEVAGGKWFNSHFSVQNSTYNIIFEKVTLLFLQSSREYAKEGICGVNKNDIA